jgi:hypothetical protein
MQCRFEGESISLTQAPMAELFQVSVPTINEHLKRVFEEAELLERIRDIRASEQHAKRSRRVIGPMVERMQ